MVHPKIKYWKLPEMHKNEQKMLHSIPAYCQTFENLKFTSQPFIYSKQKYSEPLALYMKFSFGDNIDSSAYTVQPNGVNT